MFLVTLTGALLAEPAHQLVARGNEAFSAGDYEKALSLYEEASVELPESEQVYFNRGAVFYKQENYEKAIEEFKDAALKSVEPGLTSRAKYNLGNCAFRQAQRQRDGDLKEAVEKCQESIAFYREARDLDPEYKKAAENIEIVRLYLKVLFDEQKKKEEQNDEEQEDNLVAKLKKLLKRQLELRDENEELSEKTPNGSDPAAAQGWQESLKELSVGRATCTMIPVACWKKLDKPNPGWSNRPRRRDRILLRPLNLRIRNNRLRLPRSNLKRWPRNWPPQNST